MVLGFAGFAVIALATGILTGSLVAYRAWSGLSVALWVAVLVTIGCAVVALLLPAVPAIRKVLGLVERGIYVGMAAWLACVILGLFR